MISKRPCPSFPWSFRKHQGKPQKHQGFFHCANPQKPCKINRKHSKRPRKFPGTKTSRKQKHQGKEGQGNGTKTMRIRKKGVFYCPQGSSGPEKGHKHKEFRQKPPSKGPLTPSKFFMFGASSPFKIQEKAYIKNFEGGAWGPQNSLC